MMNDDILLLKEALPILSTIPIDKMVDIDPKPFYPTRAKYVYDPSQEQALHPGLHFIVPNTLTPKEIAELDTAVFTAGIQHCSVLVSETIYNKVKEHDFKQRHPMFNYFTPWDPDDKNDRRLLFTNNCFVVSPSRLGNIETTDIDNPEYGLSLDIDTASALVQITFLLLAALIFDGRIDKKNGDLIFDNMCKIREVYDPNPINLQKIKAMDSDEISLLISARSRQFKIDDVSIQNVAYFQNFICAFHNIFTDAGPFMGWKTASTKFIH